MFNRSEFSSLEKNFYPYRVALTFDDGPHPYYTKKIIDILSRHQARATFFLVGKQIVKHPELARIITHSGHEIGNHTYHHYNLTKIPQASVADELIKTQEVLVQACGTQARWFRPPGGHFNNATIAIAKEHALSMILWDVEPRDHVYQDAASLIQKIIISASDSNIILLHSGMGPTIENLDTIITLLHNRGFSFVTVSELMNAKEKAAYAIY